MILRLLSILLLIAGLTACTEVTYVSHLTKKVLPPTKTQGTFKVGTPYKIKGKKYYPQESYDLVETGIASWYGPQFHGKQTANGETFDMNELTAAHKTLQMPSLVRVTNLENGRSLIVRVNDRGPYKRGRIIDLSKRSAELLGFRDKGTAKVKIEVMKQESLEIARAAKAGQDTGGYEVALNRGKPAPDRAPVRIATNTAPMPQPQQIEPAAGPKIGTAPGVTRETLLTPSPTVSGMDRAVPGHTIGGNFYPEAVVSEMPVTRTDIFVQAGSFTVAENAYRLSNTLRQYAEANVYPATVKGISYYRVRLGPLDTVDQADALLETLFASGNQNAIIVVE